MNNINKLKTEDTDNRQYLTWACAGGDVRMRPRGKKMSTGCGFTNTRATNRDIYNLPKGGLKGVCKFCKRKRNLNPGIVRTHHDKQDMVRFAELANWDNGGWGEQE